MTLQVIKDSKEKATGVYIPIKEWLELKKKYRNLGDLENNDSSKDEIVQELKDAILELKLIEQGKLKARPAKELLDEL